MKLLSPEKGKLVVLGDIDLLKISIRATTETR